MPTLLWMASIAVAAVLLWWLASKVPVRRRPMRTATRARREAAVARAEAGQRDSEPDAAQAVGRPLPPVPSMDRGELRDIVEPEWVNHGAYAVRMGLAVALATWFLGVSGLSWSLPVRVVVTLGAGALGLLTGSWISRTGWARARARRREARQGKRWWHDAP